MYMSTTLCSRAGILFVVLELFYCANFVLMPIESRDTPIDSGPSRGLLEIEGDVDEAQKQLCELLGTDDCVSRIQYNPKISAVRVDFTGIDRNSNEGALLLAQVVNSEYVYNLTIGNQYRSAAGFRSLGGDTIVNNSNTFDPPRFRIEKPAGVRPPKGVDALIAIDPFNARYRDSQGRRVSLAALVFHELAEAYSKVDLEKPYIDFELGTLISGMIGMTPVAFQRGAHNDAVQREIVLRSQRPDIQATGRAGDMLTRESSR